MDFRQFVPGGKESRKPKIKICNGDLRVAIGQRYIEYNAIVENYGNTQCKIISCNVNTSLEGDYEVVYEHTAPNNIRVTKKRNVYVYDKVKFDFYDMVQKIKQSRESQTRWQFTRNDFNVIVSMYTFKKPIPDYLLDEMFRRVNKNANKIDCETYYSKYINA